MTTDNSNERLWMLLGEIRTDIKHLVTERQNHGERLDVLEVNAAEARAALAERITRLEQFRAQALTYGSLIAAGVPIAITIALNFLGAE